MRRILALLILIIFRTSESISCYVQNSIPDVLTQECSSNVYECMQFNCQVSSPNKFNQVTKGCNDLTNPIVSCATIMANCQALGGSGQCYTCTGDYCNSSKALAFLILLLLPLLILIS